jgi:hypothetical protein
MENDRLRHFMEIAKSPQMIPYKNAYRIQNLAARLYLEETILFMKNMRNEAASTPTTTWLFSDASRVAMREMLSCIIYVNDTLVAALPQVRLA